MSKFKVGDVVVLKSGGPKMTIKYDDKGEYRVNWFDGENGVKHYDFREDQLELVEKEK